MSEHRPDMWMALYWGDYMRDTGHLNALQHGAYLMLIKHYWCTGSSLPDDDAVLWRIACCDSVGQWRQIKPVLARFFQITPGAWWHRRIERELAKATSVTAAKSRAGKAGASKRWQTHSRGNGKTMADA